MSDSAFNAKLTATAEKYNITIPKPRSINVKKIYDVDNLIDFEELHEVGRAIVLARQSVFQTTELITKHDASLAKAKAAYNRAWRREYLGSVQKTDTGRKTDADLLCEDLEDEVIVFTQAKDSLKAVLYALKIEMQSLQTLSSNIRQQLNM